MTKKEEQPKGNKQDREKRPKDLSYNPDITEHDKEVLNNQSLDENKGDYLEDRERPVDFEADDLDVPEMDEKQYNQTANDPDDETRNKRPKDSANNNDNIAPDNETVYKNEKAEKYKDPSKKSSDKNKK